MTTTPQADPTPETPAATDDKTGGEGRGSHLRLVPPTSTGPEAGGAGTSPGELAAVLAHAADLIDRFAAHREAQGRSRDTVRCERAVVTKFCFWLATGNLPDRGPRGKLLLTAEKTRTGWLTRRPEDADAVAVLRYRDALFAAGTAERTRSREVIQLGHFYTWLTGSSDHAVRKAKTRASKSDQNGRRSFRTPPADTHARLDGFYTPEATRLLLQAARTATAAALAAHRDNPEDAPLRREWLAREVEQLVAYLLWGTGATAAAICDLDLTDLDLDAATITWRKHQPDADQADLVTQPIPATLVTVLGDYLTRVRPELRIGDDRLLVNPCAQSKARTYLPREVQRLTRRLAEAAGLADQPGGHAPGRWAKTYGQRILDAEHGSLITLMWLQGRRAWVGLERIYGATTPQETSVSANTVFPAPAVPGRGLPPGPPVAPASGM